MDESTFTFDPEELTAREVMFVEEYVGLPLDKLMDNFTTKTAVAFVYVVKRREDPTLTVETVEDLKLTDLMAFLGNDHGGAPS